MDRVRDRVRVRVRLFSPIRQMEQGVGDDWSFMGAIGLHAKLSANVISINRS